MRTWLAAVVVFASTVVVAQSAQKFLGPGEIKARLEASPSQYKVQTLALGSNPADIMWPASNRWPSYALVVNVNGRRRVVTHACSPESEAAITAADRDFQAKRYAAAGAAYEAITAREPDCASAWLYAGDAAFFQNANEKALAGYERAVALRPDDAAPYFFRGQALLKLGRRDPAIADFQTALAIRPHYFGLLTFLRGNPKLGLELNDGFVPRVLVRGAAPDVEISVQETASKPEMAAWLVYGMCKALWLGDEKHRREMTGSSAHAFTSTEEKECLANLVFVANSQHAQSPDLRRLWAITDAKLLDAFVIYELAARVSPTIVLTLPPDQRALISRYVREYVLVDRTH